MQTSDEFGPGVGPPRWPILRLSARRKTYALAALRCGQRICKPGSVRGRSPWTIIPLGLPLPTISSNQPAQRKEPVPAPRPKSLLVARAPIWSCSRWGLPCRFGYPSRGALLPHPFTLACDAPKGAHRRSALCGTVPGVTPAGCYPAPRSVEPGLSSPTRVAAIARSSDHHGALAGEDAGCQPNDGRALP